MIEKIIVISGVARSGTSWLGQIINSSPEVVYKFQPLFSYAFKNYLNHKSNKENYTNFFEKLYNTKDSFLDQADKVEEKIYPNFEKNEELKYLALKENRYQYLFPKMLSINENLKMLGIIRHPCAVINSWLQNPKEFPIGAVVEDEWRFGDCKNKAKEENFFGFYKWREIANLYLDLQLKYKNQFFIVNYNKLTENTKQETEKIFSFLNLELSQQTSEFIKSSTSTHTTSPYSVYKDKKVKDKWKIELNKEIIDEIYFELKGTRLEQFLY